MGNYGIKIGEYDFDVKTTPTEENKKRYQLLSTVGSLIENTKSLNPSATNKFWGYTYIDSVYEYSGGSWQWVEVERCGSINRQEWDSSYTPIYLIYENKFV